MGRALRNCRLRIDTGALRHNLARVREFLSASGAHSKIMAVIKADGYGHGMLRVAEALQQADAFAVATVGEACHLRAHGVGKPVCVFHGFSADDDLAQLARQGIEPAVHQQEQLRRLADFRGETLRVWLKLDTGMHRLGLAASHWQAALERIAAAPNVELAGVLSHFANADNPENLYNNRQLESFLDVKSFYDAPASLANSAAICALPESHLDWVRPGIMLYGASPLQQRSAIDLGLRAVMQFESRLIAIQSLRRGDAIGYGGLWHCPEDMTVGVVAAGYGDGYPRHANTGTPVRVNGQSCRLVGRVSMDSLFVDLRGIDAAVGDAVELWGRHVPVDTVAQQAGTIAYELLCRAGSSTAAVVLADGD